MTKPSNQLDGGMVGISRWVILATCTAFGACTDAATAPQRLANVATGAAASEGFQEKVPKVYHIKSNKIRKIPAPRVVGTKHRGDLSSSVLVALVSTSPSFQRALLSAQPKTSLAASVSRTRFPKGVSFDYSEEYGTINVSARGEDKVGKQNSSFTLSSRTGWVVTGSPGTSGAPQGLNWKHWGDYKIIVAGAVIMSGPLEQYDVMAYGAMTTGWAATTTWPSVDVGSRCKIDAALAMTHRVRYNFIVINSPVFEKTTPGVGQNQMSNWCFGDDEVQDELPPPPPNGCIDAYNCEEGSGGQYSSSQSASYTGGAQFDLGEGSDATGGATTLTCSVRQWYQRSFVGGVWTPWVAVGAVEYLSCYFS